MSAQGAMGGKKLLSLARRLRAGDPISTEDRDFLAEELERRAAEIRGPGRPKDPPVERGLRKLYRRQMAEEIYKGIFPEWFYPPDLDLSSVKQDLASSFKQAKGNRTEADALASEILGEGHSVRSIQKARAKRCWHSKTLDDFEEEKALMKLCGSRM